MADYVAKISPFINVTFYVTSVWWEQPRNHRGLDIATPSPGSEIHSMCSGTVVRNGWDSDGYGNYIIIKDDNTGMGFLYAHFRETSPLKEGDKVIKGQYIGHEGTTGNSTGVHLHLELQDLSTHEWKFNAEKSYYSNPAEFMGIPNQEDISVIFYGYEDDPEIKIYSSNSYLTLEQMTSNAQYILNYLVAKGWTKEAVCGMLGNMQRESTINPGIWQNLDEGNTSLGVSLVQWTPATKYINWCNSNGLVWSDMDSALKRILWELENNEQYYSTDSYPESFSEFTKSTKSVEYLASAFLHNYERAGVSAELERQQNARYWYEHLEIGNIPDIPDEPDPIPIYIPNTIKKKNRFKFHIYRKGRF